MLPNSMNRITLAKASFQADEHVADIEPPYSPGKKLYILLAHRPSVQYLPFGPLKDLTYGNGLVMGRGFDELYQLSGQNVGTLQNLTLTPDLVGNIEEITDNLDAGRTQSFTYDDLIRKSTRSENPKKDPLANPVSVYNTGILPTFMGILKEKKDWSIGMGN